MTNALKQHKKQVITLLLLYLVGAIFFFNTNPERLPLLLLIVPFIYIFITLYLTLVLVLRLLQVKSAVFVAMVFSVFGVLLFVLGSLHQLTIRDVIISVALTGLLSWYVVRLTNSRTT